MHYSNAKIYKIVSDLTDKIYIGSTCSPLSKRHYQHIKAGKNKCTSSELIKLGDTRIELVEDFPCERKEQLNAREGYYIKLYKDICINRCIAGRTDKEYYKDNRDHLIEQQTLYYEANKDTRCKYQKEYNGVNKDRRKEYNKAYNEANKDRIKEYNKRYYESKKLKNLSLL